LITVFTYFVVPETNKRTLEEVDEMYLAKVPIRAFDTYDCVVSRDARRAVVEEKLEN
jgi:MFS transporter, SP family, sugar:H+ symporter